MGVGVLKKVDQAYHNNVTSDLLDLPEVERMSHFFVSMETTYWFSRDFVQYEAVLGSTMRYAKSSSVVKIVQKEPEEMLLEDANTEHTPHISEVHSHYHS